MYCPHCGKEIPDDSKFCHYCGYQISTMSKTTSPNNVLRYNLNAPKPSFSFKHISSWSETSAKSIVKYKHNMGFSSGKKNIICATKQGSRQGITDYDKKADKKLSHDDLDSDSALIFGGSDDTDLSYKAHKRFILSFENDGLLLIGIRTRIVKHEGARARDDYTSKEYSFSQQNNFISKSDITDVNLQKKLTCKLLNIDANGNLITFVIRPVWNSKIYQVKNYRHLQQLTDKLK